jgi:hypothetical protein
MNRKLKIENPYRSPEYDGGNDRASLRKSALQSLRMALVVLLMPGLYNYYCFDQTVFEAGLNWSTLFSNVGRWINLVGIAAIAVFAWLLALPILEFCTRLMHRLFSRNSPLVQWNEALYLIAEQAFHFSLAGAMIWFAWCTGFYRFGFDFYEISIPLGALAHLLAAGLYLQLVLRWYQIDRSVAT